MKTSINLNPVQQTFSKPLLLSFIRLMAPSLANGQASSQVGSGQAMPIEGNLSEERFQWLSTVKHRNEQNWS